MWWIYKVTFSQRSINYVFNFRGISVALERGNWTVIDNARSIETQKSVIFIHLKSGYTGALVDIILWWTK
jgi:hypothetical protein